MNKEQLIISNDEIKKMTQSFSQDLKLKNHFEIIEYEPIDGKYLPTNVIEKVFRKSTVTHVDKTITGNGFTYSFLYNIQPKKDHKNLLLEINQGVVKNKHDDYLKRIEDGEKVPKIQFFYGGSTSDSTLLDSTEIIVAVVNTFSHKQDIFKHLDFDKILVDEYHALSQQKTFRKILKDFFFILKSRHKETSIVTVTATPSLYQYNSYRFSDERLPLVNSHKINYVLKPSRNKRQVLHVNNNYKEMINEAKNYVENSSENVIIFTNSYNVISNFSVKNKQRKSELNATLTTGKTLKRKLVSNFTINDNERLHIISTKAFEGMDINTFNNRIYIFQDLNSIAEKFVISNVIQALNRTRNGYNKATYCSIQNNTEYPFIIDIINKVLDSGLNESYWLTKNKLSKTLNAQEIKIFRGCISQHRNPFTKEYYCIVDSDSVNMYAEKARYINQGITHQDFKIYLENRYIDIEVENFKEIKIKAVKSRSTEYYLKTNRDWILTDKLNEQPFKFTTQASGIEYEDKFYKQWISYMQLLNFEGGYIPTTFQSNLNELFEAKKTKKGFKYPSFDKFISQAIAKYIKKKDVEVYTSEKKKREDKRGFKDNVQLCALKLFAAFVNRDIEIPTASNKGRDYNVLTNSKMSLIKDVCMALERPVSEVDITSCNPRILYAINGLELPRDFYGNNKVNKTRINVLLNSFTYSLKKKDKREDHYINYNKSRFKDFGFHDKVINYLYDNFYNRNKDVLSMVLAQYEESIINSLKAKLNEPNSFRRHDSLLVLDNPVNKHEINSFSFTINGVSFSNWFMKLCYDTEFGIKFYRSDYSVGVSDLKCYNEVMRIGRKFLYFR